MLRKKNDVTRGFSFPYLEIKKLEKKFRLREMALREGTQNRPPPDAHILDATEQAVLQTVRDYNLGYRQKALSHLRIVEKKRSDHEQLLNSSEIPTIPDSTRDRVEQIVHEDGMARLKPLWEKREIAFRNLKYFKHQNHLQGRDADYPASKILFIATLLFLFVFETITNGLFLQVAQERGLIGGIAVAAGISIINVGLSALIGRLMIPSFHHIKPHYRVLGGLCLLIYGGLIIYGNLAVGIYRSISQFASAQNVFDPAAVQQAAVYALRPIENLNRLDFQSGILVAVGVFFAIAALIDGYKFDDPYPRYGAIDRKYRNAADKYEAEKNELIDKIGIPYQHARDSLAEERARTVNNISSWSALVETVEADFQAYNDWVSHMEQTANFALRIYREENKSVRTLPPPSYFPEEWRFDAGTKTAAHAFQAIAQDQPSPERKRYEIENWHTRLEKEVQQVSSELSHDRRRSLERVEKLYADIEKAPTADKARETIMEFEVKGVDIEAKRKRDQLGEPRPPDNANDEVGADDRETG